MSAPFFDCPWEPNTFASLPAKALLSSKVLHHFNDMPVNWQNPLSASSVLCLVERQVLLQHWSCFIVCQYQLLKKCHYCSSFQTFFFFFTNFNFVSIEMIRPRAIKIKTKTAFFFPFQNSNNLTFDHLIVMHGHITELIRPLPNISCKRWHLQLVLWWNIKLDICVAIASVELTHKLTAPDGIINEQ